METLITFTLFGSTLTFYASVIVLFFLLIISDLAENVASAVLALFVFLGLNYMWGNLPITEIFTLLNLGIYIASGFIYALIRTYFKGRELDPKEKKYFDLREAVFRWWTFFPISIINWVFGSLLRDAYNWTYSKVSKLFEKLFGEIEEPENPMNY